jgi:murein DD-endopeptidase MepM/ murein hydrolase activator NlpD
MLTGSSGSERWLPGLSPAGAVPQRIRRCLRCLRSAIVVGVALLVVFWRDYVLESLQGLATGLLCLLVVASAALGVHRKLSPPRPFEASMDEVEASMFDVAPSAFREKVQQRRQAGLPLPDPAEVELQERNQDFAAQQQRDQQLQLELQSNEASLAAVAKQLGLPDDRLALPASASRKGVGAATPLDLTALSNRASAPAPGIATIASGRDLQRLVADYLDLPCPLPAGDARCAEAAVHARQELARGHGLDVNKPDALPVLHMDIAQPFGPTDVEWEPLQLVDGQSVHFHEGIDLAAGYGEPVMAAASGLVVFAGTIPSGALTVELQHAGNLHSLYLHEEQLLVQVGDHVKKGQIIGLVGATGIASGPHLHFQINDPTGRPVDPLPFLQ